MSKGKSLSERLAELANPAPSLIDPEDEYNEDTKARLDRYDEDYETSVKPTKKAVKAKTSLRQSNAVLLSASDKRYAGTKVSRKDLEDDFQEPDLDSPDEGESDESEADEIEEFKKKFAKLGSAKKSPSIKATKNPTKSKSKVAVEDSEDEDIAEETGDDDDFDQDDSDAEGDSDDNEMEEEEDEELDGEDEETDDEDMEGEDELDEEDLEDESGGGLLSNFMEDGNDSIQSDDENPETIKKENKKRIDLDLKKGSCIKNQLSLWDLLLECRIKYHKSINLCNKLPQGANAFKSFTQIPGENHFVAAVQSAQNVIKTFLDSCLELQDALLKSNPSTKSLVNGTSKPVDADDDDEEIPSDSEEEKEEEEEEEAEPRRKKLKLEEYEREIDKRHQNYQDFCNRTLHTWYEKTKGRPVLSLRNRVMHFSNLFIS